MFIGIENLDCLSITKLFKILDKVFSEIAVWLEKRSFCEE